MSTGFEHDPHSEQGNECPRNLFGLKSYAQLQAIEYAFTSRRLAELEDRRVTGKFDVAHLKDIHRYIFQDVFPWAGQTRVVNISKNGSPFGPAMHLESALADALAKLKREGFLRGLAADQFAQRAAFYLGEINAIHPFREGNGRTQREFIRQLGVHVGYPLSWYGFTQERMIAASIASHLRGDNAGLTQIVLEALESTRAESAK